ncbi:protein-disulfide reductase DsbD family protein [Taibaiella koreensis]|uniref:protein-disulfide reductase DsbD family protein n=1 Tax=Taibaiella koreensis TaxID=1268548 RepID=UPI000E59E3AB|nr:thioredoxin family protein [Taibaiella koreensis]
MKRLLLLLSFLFAGMPLFAQKSVDEVVKWTYDIKKTGDSTFDAVVTAKIIDGWHIYTATPGGDGSGSEVPTKVTFARNPNIRLAGKLQTDGKPINEEIKELGYSIQYYEKKVVYTQKIVASANTTLNGTVSFMTCKDFCLPPATKKFQLKIEGLATTAAVIPDTATAADTPVDAGTKETLLTKQDKKDTTATTGSGTQSGAASGGELSLWAIFLTGLGAGFAAFVTPCIYAMLPITVSFFTKRSKNRATGIRNALFYSFSIIGIFSLIGVLISLFFKENTMYLISTSIWFNFFVFAVFVVFGISLLGAFEITLPASWSTKLDTKANSNSFGGIFFMALVLVVVSFSCTSAFISWLIVQIVQAHNRIGGLIGFMGFGIAIALPFAIFAFFPGLLNNIAKSGGWLNSVKVTMGFIELAMAMKFLSNIDLQYHWHLLDFEVYLSIWIVLSLLLGMYLLGKLKFSHDDDLPKNMFGQPYLTVTRLFFAIAALAFTVYMIPGLWGAPLSGISGWLPERKTLEFNLHDDIISLKRGQVSGSSKSLSEVSPVKYTENLKSELPGVDAFFDYEEALAASKKTGKPILLDFTGHSCVNCRKMERAVLSKPEVLRELSEDFIVASLYCDDKASLSEKEAYKSKDGNTITTLGDRNVDLEVNTYGEVGQPFYIFVDSDGKVLKKAGGYVPDVQRFLDIMKEVKSAYKKK